jgi:hypothetical protein
MVETSKPRMSKKLEARVKDVIGKNEASEVEDMKEVLEVEEVRRVEAVGSFGPLEIRRERLHHQAIETGLKRTGSLVSLPFSS